MKIRNLLFSFCLMALTVVGTFAQSVDGDFKAARGILGGEWKVEGKETYESWEESGKLFKGKGFRIRDGVEKLTENLELKIIDGAVYYLATVANQNEGATIRFKLSSVASDSLTFENPEHDFPKKIIYRKTGADSMTVEVLGAENKGFTMKFGRRPAQVK